MQEAEAGRRDVEVVLDSRQSALILDTTKGVVGACVGPVKASLTTTDQPVRFDGKEFVRCSVQESIQAFPEAREGSYIVLENPAEGGEHPKRGSSAADLELQLGRKVNIPGPVSFPLWPGQRATTVQGHTLRSNQFLVAVVYNDEEANKNWDQTVVQPKEPVAPAASKPSTDKPRPGDETRVPEDSAADAKAPEKSAVDVVKAKVGTLTMGKRLIIKGTDVSFFIPPTGVEVVPDEEGNFVRDAVTLETLEYCILVEERGAKRYVRGPAVVFPEPTEEWIMHAHVSGGRKTRKFRAIELNPESGIYVKVIADYEENGRQYEEGEELFITGQQQRIYFPRAEHAVVRYDGKSERVFAITIPAGEARYVLDKRAETIKLVKGPKIFLPDPRHEVVVRKVLSPRDVNLLFPGNVEAAAMNKVLAAAAEAAATSGYVSNAFIESQDKGDYTGGEVYSTAQVSTDHRKSLQAAMRGVIKGKRGAAGFSEEEAAAAHVADQVSRKTNYTPPRELVLDSKFDGAVGIDVWTGYAVQVRSKTGDREVVVGPKPRLLEYDETLDALDLSMGTPKSRKDGTLKTVYLRVANNRVSDKITAETSDLVGVSLVVAYRVDFKGEPEKWFMVEDYVQLLTEHTRSMIRNHIKQLGVQEFMANSVALIRDMILGKPGEKGARAGLTFEENGMVVKDVEVLDVTIGDEQIAAMLFSSQHAVVEQELALAHGKRQLDLVKAQLIIDSETGAAKHETEMAKLELEEIANETRGDVALAQIKKSATIFGERKTTKAAEQDIDDMTSERRRAREKASQDLEIAFKKAVQDIDLERTDKNTEAVVRKLEAIGPELTAAMAVHGDKIVTAEMIKELGALAALSGDSVEGIYKKLMQGSAIVDVFGGNGNGIAAATIAGFRDKQKESVSRA